MTNDKPESDAAEGKGRFIAAAAIRSGNLIFTLPRPARHHTILYEMQERGVPGGGIDQGFLTSDGRFVDRRLACDIARNAGQIVLKTNPQNQLFTEDMW